MLRNNLGETIMDFKSFYHKCSPDYLNSIDPDLENHISRIIKLIPKRNNEDAILADFFWLLASNSWCFHSPPPSLSLTPPKDLNLSASFNDIEKSNDPDLCVTSKKIETDTQSDYAKLWGSQLVQLEIQFATMEEATKDFTKFRIAFAEKRIGLGIEIVLENPDLFLSDKKTGENTQAHFDEVKKMLSMLDLDCPIWLIGIE